MDHSRIARMPTPSPELVAPIQSLISKSEKALQKLTPGTWQHAMLQRHLQALRVALGLMCMPDGAEAPSREEFQAALPAIADLIAKSEKSQAKFPPGSSQHTLQRNRIRALRAAESLIVNKAQ